MSVNELANLMKSQLSTYQRSTREEIKKLGDSLTIKIDKLKLDITADIEKLREENNTTFNELSTSIERTRADTSAAIDRSTRFNDLLASGVPFIQGETLITYFHSWCRSLGYADNCFPLVDIRRLVKGNPTAGTVYMILIQFAITVQRNDFYARYLRSRTLSLSEIGFAVNKRIYINENLGQAARELRSKALQLRKNGGIFGVFTRNGIVYVKLGANDREIAVSSEDELKLLRKQN